MMTYYMLECERSKYIILYRLNFLDILTKSIFKKYYEFQIESISFIILIKYVMSYND